MSYGLVNAVFFGVYGNTLKYLSPSATDRNNHIHPDSRRYLEMAVAGGVAGFAQVIVACPVDVVKVVLQSQLKPLGIHGKHAAV
jgi:Mitochondrial carrier protein